MKIKHDSPIPLYIQIRDFIRSNIESGNFASDSRLPSERQLAKEFKVNRLTVNKALRELELEGLIHTQTGKGTYVAPSSKIEQGLETLSSFTQEMSAKNKRATSRVLAAAVQPTDDDIAYALKILPGSEVVVLERIRLANGQCMALEKAHIPHVLCPQILENHDFGSESLYQVLEQDYGLHLTSAYQTVEARLATAHQANVLEIEPNSAVLSFTRVTFDNENRPVEFVLSTYPGDRYKLHSILKPGT